MSAVASAPPEEKSRDGLVLTFLALGVVIVVMDATIVNVALPLIREDFGFLDVSVSELQWVVNAYVLSFAVLLLSAGKLADMFGRRRIFRIGLVVFTGASIACGAAGNIDALIGFRVAQGAGAALIMPTTLSILQASISPQRLAWAIGIWSAAIGMGTAVGPVVGGLLAEEVDWRWIFYINVPIGAITLVGAFIWIRESRGPDEDRKLDIPGVLVSAVALFALTFALLRANDFGWGDPRTLGFLFLSAVAFAGFIALEQNRKQPMLDLSLFRSRTFAGANVTAVFVGAVLLVMLFYGSVFIQTIMGFSATETGASLLPMMGMLVVMAPFIGRLVGRFGTRPLLTIGMGLLAVSLLLFSTLGFESDFWSLLPAMIVGGLGFALVLSPLTAAALAGVPIQQAGVGAAVINSTRQVGGSVGLAVMGAISAELIAGSLLAGEAGPEAFVDGFKIVMYATAACAVAGSLVAWLTVARPPKAPPAEQGAAPAEPAVEEVQVDYSKSWVVAAPSVVSQLPAALRGLTAAARATPVLEVADGPAAGERITVGEEPLVLGRMETGPGSLGKDGELSRRHARISQHEDGLLVEDLGSTNGTRVNAQAISEPTPVRPGDSIEVGTSKLVVASPPAPLAGQMPAQPAGAFTGPGIEVVSGPAAGRRIALGATALVFGRAEEGDGNLGHDPELSRRHASASMLDPGRLLIEDLGSTNGTFVNGHRIAAPTVVRPGDELGVGSTRLRVVAPQGNGRPNGDTRPATASPIEGAGQP